MLRVIDGANDALAIAGSLCGVPFVGAAAVVIDKIVKTCNEVKVHKQRTMQLSSKCVQILGTLNDQARNLEGSELEQILDQLMPILEKILKRTIKWSNYNSVMTFIKNSEIKEGLDLSDAEIDTAMQLFSVSNFAAIGLHSTQRLIAETMRSNTAELRDLLLQALNGKSETQQIIELQNAGQHVAEQFMAAGQQELRLLRESIADDDVLIPRSTSPLAFVNHSQRYLEYQRGLIKLHRETGIPPTIKILNGEVIRNGELAVAGGTYSDIWVGLWLGEEKVVALKALRNVRASDPKARKRFENEINMWANLNHDHILPFYGIVTDLGQHIHMVSPWQENGNVLEYVKAHANIDRIPLIRGAAEGLAYLHSRKIIHGNSKPNDYIVVGEACICDFGMSKIIEEVTERSASATLTAGGSARWMAPELIEGSAPTVEADTYSYAMAILELLTGKHPFADCRTTAAVICSIVVHKKTPPRPEVSVGTWLSDELWDIMCKCWAKDYSSRPSMAHVTDGVREIELSTHNGKI
ncbi:TKL/TKL-ccin protein kinase [Gymnopilus junonius]|uniref:TKL/TKL-ccin protein kinase n=1 Tax=Gymnopilus junonius TaxID=109634 RepID=A0A9P5TQV8_GYMJU|nr:TKL/TKL-ccin protein kinase [Gymnopilus junonius]